MKPVLHLLLRGHATRKHRLMTLLGLLVALEFFENVMFVFSSAHVMGGLAAAPAEFVGAQAAYAVGSLMAIVLQQRLVQRWGYRRVLTVSLGLFALGLLGCSASGSLQQLALARGVQGLGGGAFFTAARVLVLLLFAPVDRPQAMRRFMVLMMSATALAPWCAASLIERWGWASVFVGVLPAVLGVALGLWRWLPDSVGRQPGGPAADLASWRSMVGPLLCFALAALCLQWGFSEARLDVLAHPLRLALLGLAGAGLLVGFLWHQWRHPTPLLHLRQLNSPVYLVGLGLYFVHYFLSNFAAYLFPIYAERGLGLPLATTGALNSLAGVTSLVVAWAYIRWAGRLPQKRPLMLAGLLSLALCAWGLASQPAGVSVGALLPALLLKGVFGVLLVLPVAGLTFRELGDHGFAHGYQGKNLMRQMASSGASAVAAVMLQNRQFALHDELLVGLNPDRPGVSHWMTSMAGALQARGFSPEQAHLGALAQLSALLDNQALLLACEDLYRLLAAMALLAALLVAWQRRLP